MMNLIQTQPWIPRPVLRYTAANSIRHLMSPVPHPRNKDDMTGWMLYDATDVNLLKKRAKKAYPSNPMLDFLIQEKLIMDAPAAELSILLSTIVRKDWCKTPYDVPFVFSDMDWSNTHKSIIKSLLFRMNKFFLDSGTSYSIGTPIFIEHKGKPHQFIFSSHAFERIIERCSLPSSAPEMACWVVSNLKPDGLAMLSEERGIGVRVKLFDKTLTDINLLGYCPLIFDSGYAVAKTFLTPHMFGTPGSERLKNIGLKCPFDNIKSLFSKNVHALLAQAGIPAEKPHYCHWLPGRI